MNDNHAGASPVKCSVRPLVDRLRKPDLSAVALAPNWATADRWMIEAADEIERLRLLLLRIARNPESLQAPTDLRRDLIAEVEKDPRWPDWKRA